MPQLILPRHIFQLRKRRLRNRLVNNSLLHVIVLIWSTALLLFLIFNDVQVAFRIFVPPSLTQTTIDTHLQHLAPHYGGEDLDPPYALGLGDNSNGKIIIQPTFGTHRYDKDAIFAIANTMEYEDYVLFITSLRDSGYIGDLVLSTPDVDTMEDDLVKFLKYHSQEKGGWVVIYDGVIRSNADDGAIHPLSNVTAEMVYLRGLYGEVQVKEQEQVDPFSFETKKDDKDEDNDKEIRENIRPMDDHRIPRSLGVARFELFWVWSKQYSPSSRILIVDGKDTYFQENAFVGMGVSHACPLLNDDDGHDDHDDGHDDYGKNEEHINNNNSTSHTRLDKRRQTKVTSDLFVYEENVKENKHKLNKVENRLMLPEAYQDMTIMAFTYNENVLSPAPTHGHQRAMEAYFRAMVKQFDFTQCAKYQCEWAFHNYLYYLGVLFSLPEIDNIKPFMQGVGAVNSIRLDVPLNETKIFDSYSHIVYNRPMGDGLRPSWAVHQYNYDPQLNDFVNMFKHEIASNLDLTKPLEEFPNYGHLGGVGESSSTQRSRSRTPMPSQPPILGEHRPDEDAIFAIVGSKNLEFSNLALFLLSIKDVGFMGDIVLHIPLIVPKEVSEFLTEYSKSFQNLIVYEGVIVPVKGGENWTISSFIDTQGLLIAEDPRPPRTFTIVGFELFQMWTTIYRPSSRILLFENALKVMFQKNPLQDRPCQNFELTFYKESPHPYNIQGIAAKRSPLSEAFYQIMGQEPLKELENGWDNIVTPESMFGHSTLIHQILTEAIRQMDEVKCYFHGCTWAVVNNIWYSSILDDWGRFDSFGISYNIRARLQGQGDVHPLPRAPNTLIQFYDREKKVFTNHGPNRFPAVVLNYKMHKEVAKDMTKKAQDLLDKYMD